MSSNGKLALLGGQSIRSKPFPSWPVHDDNEITAITEVVRSGKWWRGAYASDELGSEEQISGFSRVEAFEEKFSQHHGAQYAVATSTGLSALDIAVKSIGVGPGDEVIVPAYTFIASATCVLHNNAVPIFIDIDSESYNLDVNKLEESITKNTKAIIPVHFGGNLVRMEELIKIAQKHDLKVIEDAAHAHGVEWNGEKMAGSMGDLGMFSFQQSKNMTAGEGGIVITSDEGLYDLCFSLHHYGRMKNRPWYEMHRLGWNFRMTEFQAAVLLVQLERLDRLNEKRKKNAEYLTSCLNEIGGIQPVEINKKNTKCSYHLYIIRYNSTGFEKLHRNDFISALSAEGVPATIGYISPIYSNPMFLNKNFFPYNCPVECQHYSKDIDYNSYKEKCPVAEKACNEEAVWLTQNMLLGERDDMDSIVEAIVKVKKNCGVLKKAVR